MRVTYDTYGTIPAPARRTLPKPALAVLRVLVTLVALAMLVPAVVGFQRYVIVSGSMTGTYDKGSIVYDREVDVAQLRVGDVITYAPPAGMTPQHLVTHRIVGIGQDATGRVIYRTKGDANAAADPWTFHLDEAQQARVAFSLPYAGYAVAALSDRDTRMLLLGGPSLLIALLTVARFVRETRAHARRLREATA